MAAAGSKGKTRLNIFLFKNVVVLYFEVIGMYHYFSFAASLVISCFLICVLVFTCLV